MSIQDALAQSAAKPAGKRPYFLNPEVERCLAITMSAVQELAVTRQRLDTLERLLADKNIIARVEIEQFTPSREAAAERALWVQEYLTRILRIVQQEGEAVEALNKGDRTSEELAQEFAAAAN
jgi:hypothetical protein